MHQPFKSLDMSETSMARTGPAITTLLTRSFYPLPRMTDSFLSTSLRQLTGSSGEVAQQSHFVNLFTSYAGRQHTGQAATRRMAHTSDQNVLMIGRMLLLIYMRISLMISRDPQIGASSHASKGTFP